MASDTASNSQGGSLFLDTDQTGMSSNGPGVTRSRWVKINSALLLDAQDAARALPPHAEITLSLFPDTTYTAVIEQVQDDGNSISWVGHLKGVDTSEFTLVYTGGIFAGHFASPGSVYEVSSDGGDLYRIVQIDQQKLPGGEGDVIPARGS